MLIKMPDSNVNLNKDALSRCELDRTRNKCRRVSDHLVLEENRSYGCAD